LESQVLYTPEIQAYFRSVAEKYHIVDHIRFHSVVEKAAWNDLDSVWEVTIMNLQTKERTMRRARILVLGVGSLSVPKKCELPGWRHGGKIFHSAQWDHSFDWADKDIVVLGMYQCLSNPVRPNHGERTERCAEACAARTASTGPSRTSEPLVTQKPSKPLCDTYRLSMCLYRAKFYYDMERDWSGFDIDFGRSSRQELAKRTKPM
jgi:hypothetical protein